jgi:hypothetical protein
MLNLVGRIAIRFPQLQSGGYNQLMPELSTNHIKLVVKENNKKVFR